MLNKISELQRTASRRIIEEGISKQVDIMNDMIHEAFLVGMQQGKAQRSHEIQNKVSRFLVTDFDDMEWED